MTIGEKMDNLENKTINVKSLDSLLEEHFPATRWTVENIIPQGGLTILSAAPGSFKTWVMLEIALVVADGRKLFGKYASTKTGVLLVDEESGPRMLQERFVRLGSNRGLSVHYVSRQNTKVSQNYIDELIETCSQHGIGLVMFDSLVRLHSSDENASKDMSELFELFRQLTDKGLSVLIAHHNRKSIAGSFSPSGVMRGSSDILAAVDCHMALGRNSGSEYVTIKQTKNRYTFELSPFKVKFSSNNDISGFEFVGEKKSRSSERNSIRNAILSILQEKDNITKKDLHEYLKTSGNEVGVTRLREMLEEMNVEGFITSTPGPRNSTYYEINPLESNVLKSQ